MSSIDGAICAPTTSLKQALLRPVRTWLAAADSPAAVGIGTRTTASIPICPAMVFSIARSVMASTRRSATEVSWAVIMGAATTVAVITAAIVESPTPAIVAANSVAARAPASVVPQGQTPALDGPLAADSLQRAAVFLMPAPAVVLAALRAVAVAGNGGSSTVRVDRPEQPVLPWI